MVGNKFGRRDHDDEHDHDYDEMLHKGTPTLEETIYRAAIGLAPDYHKRKSVPGVASCLRQYVPKTDILV